MKKLFDELAYKVCEQTTKKYSTSFSLGILALSPKIRPAIYAIYGYVRLADEIVDSFHEYDKERLLMEFGEQTEIALEQKISLNPVLQAFQETVHRYNIDRDLIRCFLKSMKMDLEKVKYNTALYKEYIMGSAEAVGLMCLHVFTADCPHRFETLKFYAMKLGSAFQKINFLRDLKDDYQTLGRTYFPDVDLLYFDQQTKKEIERDIQVEFKEALIGIRSLPASSRYGVYLAYRYYVSLFRKIIRTSPQKIKTARVRISNGRKVSLMIGSYMQYKLNCL